MTLNLEPYRGYSGDSVTLWDLCDNKILTNHGFMRIDEWAQAEAQRMNGVVRKKKYRAGLMDGKAAVVMR
jgi:hypothetical protein